VCVTDLMDPWKEELFRVAKEGSAEEMRISMEELYTVTEVNLQDFGRPWQLLAGFLTFFVLDVFSVNEYN
jgi:hypothetical protein